MIADTTPQEGASAAAPGPTRDPAGIASRLARPDGWLAYHRVPAGAGPGAAAAPGLVFLTGYMSEMTSGKALAVEALARRRGWAALRFDYRGHGASSGAFEDGTLGLWLDDALAAFDALTAGPQILVGSSMGGWIAVLLALARPERVAGLVTVAAAVDMTERVIRPRLDADAIAELARHGRVERPSPYGPRSFVVTARFLEEAKAHQVLDRPLPLTCPARLIHGVADPDIPWRTSLDLADRLAGDDVRVILVKDGGHRLSEPRDLALLAREVAALAAPG